MKRSEQIGVRLTPEERQLLVKLADKESRTPSGWLRSRMKAEAERLCSLVQPHERIDNSEEVGR